MAVSVDHSRDEEKIRRFDAAYALVQKQAEDVGLWFIPEHITEDYLQKQLRLLHSIIEDEGWVAQIQQQTPPATSL